MLPNCLYRMNMFRKTSIRRWLTALLAMTIGAMASAQSPEVLVGEGLAKILPGYQFNKRLAGPTEQDHILVFNKGPDCALVSWTEGNAKTFAVPASNMNFAVYDSTGKQLSTLLAQNFALTLVLAKDPAFYVPQQENPLLQVAALAQTVPSSRSVRGPQVIDLECEFVNPMNKPLILSIPGQNSVAVKPGDRYSIVKEVRVGRSPEPMQVQIGASGIFQNVTIFSENPVMLDVRADLPGRLTVDMVNPTSDPFSGRLAMKLVGHERPPFEFPVEMGPRESIKELQIPLGIELPLPQPVQLSLIQPVGNPRQNVVLTQTAPIQFLPVKGLTPGSDQKPIGWKLVTEGKLFAEVRAGQPPKGAPWGDNNAMLAYKFDQPGAIMQLTPTNTQTAQIAEVPAAVGFWINGDRSGNLLSVRWRDATGKIFQPKPREVKWSGWRYETFATDPDMQAPITWESLAYIQAAKPTTGAIMISGPVLTYRSRLPSEAAADKQSVEVKEDISYGNPVQLDPKNLAPASGG